MTRLGQHFLTSPSAITAVLQAIPGKKKKYTILEVGPGKGALTKKLLEAGHAVLAIEKDATLYDTLKETFEKEITNKQATFILGDVRDIHKNKILQTASPYIVVANIPYYLTGTMIRSFLTSNTQPTSMTLVIQKEVAERIARSKKESLLSLSVKLYGEAKYIKTIPPKAFRPAPKVSSAIIVIDNIQNVPKKLEKMFFEIIHIAFAQKRKVVIKKFQTNKTYTSVSNILQKHGIESSARAEDVPFDIWLKTAKEIAGD